MAEAAPGDDQRRRRAIDINKGQHSQRLARLRQWRNQRLWAHQRLDLAETGRVVVARLVERNADERRDVDPLNITSKCRERESKIRGDELRGELARRQRL